LEDFPFFIVMEDRMVDMVDVLSWPEYCKDGFLLDTSRMRLGRESSVSSQRLSVAFIYQYGGRSFRFAGLRLACKVSCYVKDVANNACAVYQVGAGQAFVVKKTHFSE
jgi:hypothetical protein